MDSSLQKFNQLPVFVKEKLSALAVLKAVEELEKKYRIKLALSLIKMAVGDLTIADFSSYLTNVSKLEAGSVREISQKFKEFLAEAGLRVSEVEREAALGRPAREAVFAFSTEDEHEVDNFRQLADSGEKIHDHDYLAGVVISRFGFLETDEVIKKRLHNIVTARLRDIRDDLETLESLQKSRKIGGLGFTEEQSRRLLGLIKNGISGQWPKNSPNVKEPETSGREPSASVAASSKAELEKKVLTLQEKKKQEETSVGAGDYPKVRDSLAAKALDLLTDKRPISQRGGRPRIEEEDGLPVVVLPEEEELMIKPLVIDLQKKPRGKVEIKEPQLPPKASENIKAFRPLGPQPSPFASPRPVVKKVFKTSLSSRPNLDDVKFAPKLMGPVEELESMTLIDFRRLGQEPKEIARKIKEKIDLLENESYSKKLEGVEAWQKNEVNRFYRLLGQASLAAGQGIEEIISERLASGKPTLTVEEFESVMELNKDLRF
ncbi:MAG: hypothetical protein WC518_00245 [Patescibacteria group bacterium]